MARGRKFCSFGFYFGEPVGQEVCFGSQQFERAALSISLNIAEGAGRKSEADFQRFTKISTGSVNECVTLLIFMYEEKKILKGEFEFHYEWLTKISKMLNALYKSLS